MKFFEVDNEPSLDMGEIINFASGIFGDFVVIRDKSDDSTRFFHVTEKDKLLSKETLELKFQKGDVLSVLRSELNKAVRTIYESNSNEE